MKKVYVHLADGFEEIEALAPVDILRRAGCEVVTVSMTGRRDAVSSRGVRVIADRLFEETDYAEADMLVLPGGIPGATNLDAHEGLRQKIIEHHKNGKWLAAICGAPKVFGHLNLMDGRTATCYPGVEPQLAGATCTEGPVEIDGQIITGRAAGQSLQFGLALVEVLRGRAAADAVKQQMVME